MDLLALFKKFDSALTLTDPARSGATAPTTLPQADQPENPLVMIYQLIPSEVDGRLSVREVLSLNVTCIALAHSTHFQHILEVIRATGIFLSPPSPFPLLSAMANFIGLEKSEIPSEQLIAYVDKSGVEDRRYVAERIAADNKAVQQFNFPPYLQQLLKEGKITLTEAKKLDEFFNSYKNKKFDSNDARAAWLQNTINNDDLLFNYFSPSYLYWPKYTSLNWSNSTPFDLNVALLMGSKGVNKYVPSDKLDTFFDDIIRVANNRKYSSSVFTSILIALNNEVFQAYLDKDQASLGYTALFSYFGCHYFDSRKDPFNYVTNPIVKKYVDEGIVSNLNELVDMSHAGLNMLSSPTVRQAYEHGECTLDDLKKLIAQFCDQNRWTENRLLPYFTCGYWNYDLIKMITPNLQKSLSKWGNNHGSLLKNLTVKQLQRFNKYQSLMKTDGLTLEDIISESFRFSVKRHMLQVPIK